MPIRPVHLLPAALLLAACQPSPAPDADTNATPSLQAPEAAAAIDDDVIVSTNEPFWQASVEGDTVILRGIDTTERRLTGARESMTADGRRIDASDAEGSVVLIVRRMRCADDMSGARFPMTGLLTIDGRGPFRGCARPASMPVPRPPEEIAAEGPGRLPDAFVGRWDADAEACAQPDSSDMGLVVAADRLTFHESIATPTVIEPLDGNAVRVVADYEGEGQQWSAEQTLRLEGGGDRLVIEGAERDGVSRVRCAN